MTRKKFPAFGAALMQRRRRGEHPLCVHVIFGFKWREPTTCSWQSAIAGEHPLLAVRPVDYAPGTLDWSVIVGLRVALFDQVGEAAWYENPDLGPARPELHRVYSLIGELAEFAADVVLHSPAFAHPRDAEELAFCMRYVPFAAAPHKVWPHWWSQEIEERNGKRRSAWWRAFGELQFGAEAAA